jgi:hypothetical protein
MTKNMLFDGKCYELANYFLEGKPLQEAISDIQIEANKRSLAGAIQLSVEEWFEQHPAETTGN